LGGNGNDRITGNSGNDIISGGSGDDLLLGASNTSQTFLTIENDRLTGGLGKDTFVLGNAIRVLYGTFDESDFAAIADLNTTEDKVQLKGSSADYFLDFFKTTSGVTNAAIIYDPGVTSEDDLIAIVQNAPVNLSLSNSAFIFV
jgi:Ca2+-binding RTX toxin-like protein